jgi:hypothetical protein
MARDLYQFPGRYEDYGYGGDDLAYDAVELLEAYKLHGDPKDLDKGVTNARRANEILSPSDLMYEDNLSYLIFGLRETFKRTKQMKDLDEITRVTKRAVEISEPGTAQYDLALFWVCQIAVERFKATRLWRDLEDGIRVAELHILSVQPSSKLYHALLELTAIMYETMFDATRNIANLREAVRHSEQGLLQMKLANPELEAFLYAHLSRLLAYAKLLEDVPEVERLIDPICRFFASLEEDSPDFTKSFYLYCRLLGHLYFLSGKPSDLLKALNQCLMLIRLMIATKPFESGNNVIEYLQQGIRKVTRLVGTPQDDPIATQVSRALHASYCSIAADDEFLRGLVQASVREEIVVRVQVTDPNTLEILPEDVVVARMQLATSLGARAISMGQLLPVRASDLDSPENFASIMSSIQSRHARLTEALERNHIYSPEECRRLRDG